MHSDLIILVSVGYRHYFKENTKFIHILGFFQQSKDFLLQPYTYTVRVRGSKKAVYKWPYESFAGGLGWWWRRAMIDGVWRR